MFIREFGKRTEFSYKRGNGQSEISVLGGGFPKRLQKNAANDYQAR
jgi:hypothetical protein